MSADARTVVITGASSGIGQACAVHLDALGWRVFAGVRRDVDGDALQREASERLTPIRLDLTDGDSVRGAIQLISGAVENDGLDGLVNNAGIAYGGPVEYLDLARLRETFEVNFFGLLALTKGLIPLLRRTHGRIIMMSSISGMAAAPFLSPYSSSKFAVEALSDALRLELQPWGIKVIVMQPGGIDTPIWDKGRATLSTLFGDESGEGRRLYGDMLDSMSGMIRPHGSPAADVARAVAQALSSHEPRTRYRIGLDGKLAGVFRHAPDSLRDAFFRARMRRGKRH
jgi:NAD(P)-dependent dehydrogenase (short-subunit alcohol dehydrogenase family)